MPETFTADLARAQRIRRKAARWAAQGAVWAVVLPIALMLIAVPLRNVLPFGEDLLSGAAAAWLVGWLAAPVLGGLSWLLSLRGRLPASKAEVEDGNLRLTGGATEMTIPREEMTGALVVTGVDDLAEVEVGLASGNTLCMQLVEAERAEPLVDALGFGAADRRMVVPLGGPRGPLAAGCGAVLVGLGAAVLTTCGGLAAVSWNSPLGDLLGFAIGGMFVAGTLAAARVLTPRRVVIGKDGVLFEGPIRRRFFPRASIFAVDWLGQHLALLIKAGDEVREVRITSESGARQAALLQRIRAALDLHAKGGADPRAERLARGGETIDKWRERLRRLAAPEKGYRGESIPAETLVHTAGDADAKAEVRVGAALAIGLGHDDAAKRELRRSIEAIASDKLRVALEAAASGEADEEALAAALEEEALAAQDSRPRRIVLPRAEAPREDTLYRPPARRALPVAEVPEEPEEEEPSGGAPGGRAPRGG